MKSCIFTTNLLLPSIIFGVCWGGVFNWLVFLTLFVVGGMNERVENLVW